MQGLNYQIKEIVQNDILIIKRLDYEYTDPKNLDLSILKNSDRDKFNAFGSSKRKLEFYFTRVLLKTLPISPTITYKATGKPIINEGHISISHAKNVILIGYSPRYIIGVDIEFYSPKISRIKEKFVGSEEKNLFDLLDEKIITVLWSIKEAIYKMEDIPGLLFKEHIQVKSIKTPGEVKVIKSGIHHHYRFWYSFDLDSVITYCYRD